ncbi:MAG TPA: Mur ligase family protein [Actinomycetota bacterium]|nr:Mur ligase family protein [Actinomycetota bacterium]
MAPTPAAEAVELRVLDGPNVYFPRPAVKLTLAVPGWLGAGEERIRRAMQTVGVPGAPGAAGTERRRRTVAKIAAGLTRELAARAGVRRLAVRGRPGPEAGTIVVAFPWRRRGSAEALARAAARSMRDGLRRSPARVLHDEAVVVAAADPGPEPTVPDPTVPVIQVTGTNGKTTTVRLLAHVVRTAGLHVAYSSTDGVYRDDRRVKKGDYSGFGGAALALRARPDVAVLETARGGILLRGIGVRHNDVAVVTNVSADHLGLQGIDTVDQLAEVKATITRITRPGGWDLLNADDPRVLAMRRHATGRIWIWSRSPEHPAIREVLADGGRATTVLDGRITWLEGGSVHPVVPVADVPLTIAGLSSIFTSNALAAASAALAVGLPSGAVARGLRSFVPDPERNPGRANLFALDGRTVVIDYAHNEAGMLGLTEILEGLRPRDAEIWLAICTAGDRTEEILHGFGFRAAVGSDHLAVADLPHYTRGRTAQEVYDALAAAAATAGVHDPPRYRGELHALQRMLAASRRGDVLGVTALGMRPQLFRWLAANGARRLTPADVQRRARAAARSRAT